MGGPTWGTFRSNEFLSGAAILFAGLLFSLAALLEAQSFLEYEIGSSGQHVSRIVGPALQVVSLARSPYSLPAAAVPSFFATSRAGPHGPPEEDRHLGDGHHNIIAAPVQHPGQLVVLY